MSQSSPATILNVNDNDAHRYAFSRILQQAGFAVKEAKTGEEALRLAAEVPDVIILDVKLPDMDGFEVCRRIKEGAATAHIPVLQVSAFFTSTSARVTGLESGADAYLAQPVEPEELVAIVRTLLRARQAEDALRESEQRLRMAQLAANIASWDWDLTAGRVFWPQELYQVAGLDPSLPPSRETWVEHIVPEDRQGAQKQLEEALNTEQTHIRLEYRFRGSDNVVRWINRLGRIYRDEQGKPVRVLGIISDVTERKLGEESRRDEELRRQLLEHVLSAQEEERRRVARELHDEAGQLLTSLLVGLRSICGARTLVDAKNQAQHLREITAQAIEGVGRLARGLHASVLDDLGLAAALARYASDYSRVHGIAVELDTGELEGVTLPTATQTGLFRIIQEALTNVAKHSGAKRVSVNFKSLTDSMQVSVQDDGKGFSVARPAGSASNHLGLQGMRERAAIAGGELKLHSAPGEGTTVTVVVPRIDNGETQMAQAG